ncbi:prolyl oligopeptidase family serine peptidase [Lichenicoccus sp.]|uniref:prolyl oligopeptidase family serine peptidase n=1 Tax=Lichenicoccus sp. TaxID=2781899 RepID=UPI003D1478D1
MPRTAHLLAALLIIAGLPAVAAPPAFLSSIHGKQAMAWVQAQNRRSLGVLQSDVHFAPFHKEALALLQTHDRIPAPEPLNKAIYNFWQDSGHVRGIWRRTSLAFYRTATPAWHTVIDLDALSRAEHANWVWKGANCAEPQERFCLVSLSDGGEDAVTEREFDLKTGRFVPGGFTLPRSKQQVDWLDDTTLLVARDWGPGTMTESGYAFVVKSLTRGAALGQAHEIFRGSPHDVSVSPETFTDGDGHRATLIERAVSFFSIEHTLVTPSGLLRLDLPPRSTIEALVDGRLVVEIDQDWTPKQAPPVRAGSLVSLELADPTAPPMLIFAPGPRQTVDSMAATKTTLAAAIYDNVRGQGRVFTPTRGGWQAKRLTLPENVSVEVAATSPHDDRAFFGVTGFLDPSTLWLAETRTGATARIKALPAQFDARPYVVEQFEARSKDGTMIPYFLVHRRDMKLSGANPTELYAYGGFQVSMTPLYSALLGKLWLAHGGVYALANIRGGGEFGPKWHEAAIKTHRQRAFDDFAAVGRDLIARGVTSPRRLGIRGGSNGGLLMGVEFIQHPSLWRAVMIEVPLLDMLHYETMAAGASWVGEYGSVSIPAQRAFLASISPLANLKAGVDYPEPFLFTTSRDDRVGPVHARHFAWKMQQLHLPFLYYEETEGGHAAGANLREIAREQALEYTYLTAKLME